MQNPTKQSAGENLYYEIPRLLEHRDSAQILKRPQGDIIVVQYWNRTCEYPLVFRMGRQQQVEREYEFFSTHTDQLNAMGFQKISQPLYDVGVGAVAYVAYETEQTFGEFDLPWPHLRTNLQGQQPSDRRNFH